MTCHDHRSRIIESAESPYFQSADIYKLLNIAATAINGSLIQ